MVGIAAVALFAAPSLAPPIPWASGFAPEGSWAFVADMDGDGYADLVRVQPHDDAFIDVSLNVDGMKAGRPARALSNWGKNCEAATVGNLDNATRATVVGIFDGVTLRLARCDAKGAFTDVPLWSKLPAKLAHPHLAVLSSALLAWDEGSGRGFRVESDGKSQKPVQFPRELLSIQPLSTSSGTPTDKLVFEFKGGDVRLGTMAALNHMEPLGKVAKGQNAIVAGDKVYVDTPAASPGVTVVGRPKSKLPDCPSIWASGDVDKDGDIDLFQFRFGKEEHTTNDVLMYRTISPGEVDSDHDGVSNDEEVRIGSDPYNPCTSGDGLLDGWKVNGFRGLDMKAMGCNPCQVDIICLISRFPEVKEDFAKTTFDKVRAYYKSIPVKNRDGSTGWHLHTVFLPVVSADDTKKPWWENRDKFIPSKWKGVVHWMQITGGGGGQADELGDGGGCGGGGMALYATFIHEFGHQLGLPHNGFYGTDGCPTYPSLMNYPYSYTLNGSINNVSYSDGRLAKVVIRETDLDKELPLPYEKVKFLENAPYRFHLKRNGATTLIDWNWDGNFNEHHVRADINYAYSTTAGRRDNVGKTEVSPCVFAHKGKAYVLYARDSLPANPKVDPTLGPDKPGALYMKRLKKPFEWEKEQTVEQAGITGDPVAASYGGKIVIAYQTKAGVVVRDVDDLGSTFEVSKPEIVETNGSMVPSMGEYDRKLWLFLWDPATQTVQYRIIRGGTNLPQTLPDKSTVPVGPATDTINNELILGMAQDQDTKKVSRWQVRRYILYKGRFVNVAMDWIQGEKGDSHGRSRPTVLFDADKRNGPDGRIYYFTLGDHGKESPWACGYVAMTIVDKKAVGGHVLGGWIVKRYYDEWTQSRSTVSVAFFGGDILYAYRWVDGGQGKSDNEINIGYKGSGIEDAPMGDFDDLSFMHDFGIQHSLMYLNKS